MQAAPPACHDATCQGHLATKFCVKFQLFLLLILPSALFLSLDVGHLRHVRNCQWSTSRSQLFDQVIFPPIGPVKSELCLFVFLPLFCSSFIPLSFHLLVNFSNNCRMELVPVSSAFDQASNNAKVCAFCCRLLFCTLTHFVWVKGTRDSQQMTHSAIASSR